MVSGLSITWKSRIARSLFFPVKNKSDYKSRLINKRECCCSLHYIGETKRRAGVK